MYAATAVQLLEHCRSSGCDVGVGVAFEQLLDSVLEFGFVVFGYISQSVEEHELRHDFRQRIIGLHLGKRVVHVGVAVADVGVVGLRIKLFLHVVHASQIVEVVGVFHRLSVSRLLEVGGDELSVALGGSGVALAHIHQVEVVVGVEAVDVVGVASEQRVELGFGAIEVLKFVL